MHDCVEEAPGYRMGLTFAFGRLKKLLFSYKLISAG